MLTLTLAYGNGARVRLLVPDIGLTPREWAAAAYAATNQPATTRYGVDGAADVARAIWRDHATEAACRALGVGDAVHVLGTAVTCLAVSDEPRDAWCVATPTFDGGAAVPAPAGPGLHVSADTPPPESVAYAEDARDRRWTGKGYGVWRCLTDLAGRTRPAAWGSVWRDHGPLVPLVPVTVLPEPEVWAERPEPHLDVEPHPHHRLSVQP
jgi:hypothetical protein